jgi:hypothetical protein
MRRRLAAMAAALSLMLTTFTVAAPNAFAYRDTGWHGWECHYSNGYAVFINIRVEWFSSDNHRRVWGQTYQVQPNGSIVNAASLGFWVKAVDGDWKLMVVEDTPDYNVLYYEDWWPAVNPDQGHYWLTRGRDSFGDSCDSPIQLN